MNEVTAILENPQHEAFCQAVASGMESQDAYAKVFTHCTKRSANSCGPRLLAKVVARVRELQKASATAATLTMQERREFLARVVRLDMTKFDFTKDGDLIQEITRIEGSKNEAGLVKVKTPGKRECLMSDAELAGEFNSKGGINVNVGVQVNNGLTDAEHAELIKEKRASNERLLAAKAIPAKTVATNGAGTNSNGNGANGHGKS